MALRERIKPILMINKMDRLFLELQLDDDTLYQTFEKIIDDLNIIIGTFELKEEGISLFKPELGNVAFGSGRLNWAFSCLTFAKLYANKFGIDCKRLQEKLWGDNYFDLEQKKWLNHNKSNTGKLLQNSFIQLILSPIQKLTKAVMDGNKELIQKMVSRLNITINCDDFEGKQLLKNIMSSWINSADALLEMVLIHLPSPKQAQKYRIDTLQQGPQNDVIAEQMRDCNPNGPLVIYISKMMPSFGRGTYYAFGRIFSGTFQTGQQVRILGSNYVQGSQQDLFETQLQKSIVFFGRQFESFTEIPCGNLINLIGIDKYLTKCGTITDHPDCQIIRSLKLSNTPVVKVFIQPKLPKDLPRLIEGVKNLVKCDQSIQYTFEETGQLIVAFSGEKQMQIGLEELEYEHAHVQFLKSDPFVEYKETVTSQSNIVCMTKSPNKFTRIYGQAMPLEDPFTSLIEKGQTSIFENEVKLNIWAFGPNNRGPNILVDQTNVQLGNVMMETKDSMVNGWQWTTREGPLCGENQRGIRVNILHGVFHPDAIHRGGGQMISASRRLYYACELTAEPCILEPVYETEIITTNNVIGNVYTCLNMRKGIVLDGQPIPGSDISKMRANLRVSNSFGFEAQLRAMTQGQAFYSSIFDHWAQVDGDPLKIGSKANELVFEIRKRKGLKVELPKLEDYID